MNIRDYIRLAETMAAALLDGHLPPRWEYFATEVFFLELRTSFVLLDLGLFLWFSSSSVWPKKEVLLHVIEISETKFQKQIIQVFLKRVG